MKPPRPKAPRNLSVANQSRLTAYATAATAAGVGVLALAAPSEAEVVYTPTHLQLRAVYGGVPAYKLDLNGDGIADFELINSTFGHGGDQSAKPRGRNQVLGAGPYASALSSGAAIGPNGPFNGASFMARWINSSGSIFSHGPWVNVRDRYLGFRFLIQGEYHFGWARISLDYGLMHLTGYAYETVANQPITAGQETGSADDATNISQRNSATPAATATLGRLARGAAGLAAWRREDADLAK
jgi:hypothetical protein